MKPSRQLRLVEMLESRQPLHEFFGMGRSVTPKTHEVSARGRDLMFEFEFVFPLDLRHDVGEQLIDIGKNVTAAAERAKGDAEYAVMEALRKTRESGAQSWTRSQPLPVRGEFHSNLFSFKTGHVISYSTPLTDDELDDVQVQLDRYIR